MSITDVINNSGSDRIGEVFRDSKVKNGGVVLVVGANMC